MNPAVLIDIIVLWFCSHKKTSAVMAGVLAAAFLQSAPVGIPYWLVNNSDEFNVLRYGASGIYDQGRANGAQSAGDTFTTEAGQAVDFRSGTYVAIPGAGGTHAFSSVTPTAPYVQLGSASPEVGGAGRIPFVRQSGNVVQILTATKEWDFLGFGTNYTFTANASTNRITCAVPPSVDDGHPMYFETTTTLPGGMTAGPWYYRRVTDFEGTLHSSAANAISGTSPLDITSTGTGTHTFHVEIGVVVRGSDLPDPLVSGDPYYLRRDTSSQYRWTFHTTAAGAGNNTAGVTLTDDGTGTHVMTIFGDRTYNFRLAVGSEGGGLSVRSTTAQITNAPPTLKANCPIHLSWDAQDNGSGTLAERYVLYGDPNGSEHCITEISAAPNARKVTFQVSGWTDLTEHFIGTGITVSGTTHGIIHTYDNATRTVVVKFNTNRWNHHAFGNGTVTNLGTVTGASPWCFAYTHVGDKDTRTDNKSLALRTGVCTQLLTIMGTPTGGTYTLNWGGYSATLPYNAVSDDVGTDPSSTDTDDVKDALQKLFPDLVGIEVTQVGTSPNVTHIIRFQNSTERGLGEVPEIIAISSMSGGSNAISYGTLIHATNYVEGDKILHPPTSAGEWFECSHVTQDRAGELAKVTLSTTLNAQTVDAHDVTWARRDCNTPKISPTAAINDLYKGQVVSSNSANNQLRLNPNITAVPDDTPIFHDDGPGIGAALTAMGGRGGRLVLPFGDYSIVTKDRATDFFFVGGTGYAWAGLTGGRGGIIIEGNGSKLRFRPTDVANNVVDLSPNNPPDYEGSIVMFRLQQCGDLEVNNLIVSFASLGEPWSENDVSQNFHQFSAFGTGGSDSDYLGGIAYRNCTWYKIIPGRQHMTDAQTGLAKFYNCKWYYGWNGHDACCGDGEYYSCYFEGCGRWRSTWIYTTNSSGGATRIINCDVKNPGSDLCRLRAANWEWIGGTVVDRRGFETQRLFLIEDQAVNGWMSGVKFNTIGEFGIFGATNCKMDNCQLRNSYFQTGTNLTISDLTVVHTDGVRLPLGAAVQVQSSGVTISNMRMSDSATVSRSLTVNITNGNDLACTQGGIELSGSGATNCVITGGNIECSENALETLSTFVGTLHVYGGRYHSTDRVNNSNNESCRFSSGNGAKHYFNGPIFDSLDKADEVNFNGGGATTQYFLKNAIFLCEGEFESGLTGQNFVEDCHSLDATQNFDFADAGTIVRRTHFAAAPNVTGADLSFEDCTVGNSKQVSIAAPIAASANDQALPATPIFIVTLTGNQNFTGAAARANDDEYWIVNADGTDTLTVKNQDAASAAANRIYTPGGGDLAVGPNGIFKLKRLNNAWYALAP